MHIATTGAELNATLFIPIHNVDYSKHITLNDFLPT